MAGLPVSLLPLAPPRPPSCVWCACEPAFPGLLARRPRVLILDEPLAGVDAPNQRKLVRLLEDLRRDTGLTVVVISHDFVGLEGLCPRILHLSGGVLEPAASAEGVS